MTLLQICRCGRSHTVRNGRLGCKPRPLVMVVGGHRWSWLWRTRTGGLHTLCRISATVARLLYGGGSPRTGCCSGRRRRGSCDGNDIACSSIAIRLSTNIFATRTILKRVLRWSQTLLSLAVWRGSVCGRPLSARRRMMILLARYWTRLVCKAWIGTAPFAAVVGRVCIPAGLFFLFVPVVGGLRLVLMMVEGLVLIVVEVFLLSPLLLFLVFVLGMKRVGHAPFRFLFLLSGRHIFRT
jgi:hypothetical protein